MATNRDNGFTRSRSQSVLCLLFVVSAAIVAVAAIGSSRATGQRIGGNPINVANKIAPWVVAQTANGQQADFIVVLADQADLRPAAALAARSEKGRFVRDALWAKSQAKQRPILRWLREQGIEHRSFYIVNAILVRGTREIAQALAARPEVARVEGNPQIPNVIPQPASAVERSSRPRVPATIEPGITYTHAPDVWALGFKGQGITVAGADTGQRWTHNALKPHYRGWDGQNVDHDYNWHDSIHDSAGNPCGNDSAQPCDDNGHGTHTIGTVVGDDGAGNQIGMAPDAKWIGCRNMDQGNGTPARYIECMEFFLAPYPVNGGPNEGDPLKAPDITSNSWVCPPSEGCSANTLQAAVEAQAAAGIMMVAGAGNDGPNCSTVMYPPAIYEASYTVGALNTGTDTIAGFSSRGPVTIDGSNRLKPDITAPGTNTRSSYNTSDDAYAVLSGTSMATPHIAGAMALLWCAEPQSRHDIAGSRTVLDNAAHVISSTQCGDAGPPNNVYGWGRIDISAAVGPTPSPNPSCPPPTRCYKPVELQEHFDNVVPPTLPPDWTATNAQGPPPLWVTSDSGVPMPPADTAPNAVFIDDPAVVSDKMLDSLQFNSFAPVSPHLVFRHNFNLEASDEDPALGFDGGVLEISFDGGNTFQDILAAGGSFAMGGYNRTISSDRGSPIAGRQAWSGNSEGFITTVVNLPIACCKPNRLRWRMASDSSGSSEGWRVDTVNIAWCEALPCSTPTPTPTPPITPTPTVTPSVTPTVTPTPTATATATPRATPRPRPTPHPRPSPL